MDFSATLLAPFLLGLLGSAHCFGMCGGIMAAFAMQAPAGGQTRLSLTLTYNAGRVLSYTLFGVAAAAVAGLIPASGWPLARTLAGVMLIAMGMYLGGWWYGLRHLERIGGRLWTRVGVLGRGLTAGASPLQTLALGMVWGWLPCGLVYSALVYAAVQESTWHGGIIMLAFGAGTIPAVVAGGWLISSVRTPLTRAPWRWLLAMLYIAFGIWTIYMGWSHTDHNGHRQQQPSSGQHLAPHHDHGSTHRH